MNSTKKVKNIMIKSRKNAKSSKKNVNKKFFLAKLGYTFFWFSLKLTFWSKSTTISNPQAGGISLTNEQKRDVRLILCLKVSWHEIFLFQNMLPINAFIKVAFLFFEFGQEILLQSKVSKKIGP